MPSELSLIGTESLQQETPADATHSLKLGEGQGARGEACLNLPSLVWGPQVPRELIVGSWMKVNKKDHKRDAYNWTTVGMRLIDSKDVESS